MIPFIRLISNIVLCSIPEEFYAICLCLALVGMAKQIKLNRKLIMSIITPAILSNIIRYYLNVNAMINFTVFVLIMSTTLVLIYRLYNIKRILLIFICTVTACVSNMIFEILNYGILMMCTPLTESILKTNVLYAFLSSLPFRIIEILFIIMYIRHKKNIDYKIRINLWQQIIRNKDQRYFALIVSIFNILWVVGSIKLFIIDTVLVKSNIKLAPSLFLLIGDILLPVALFVSLIFSIYCARAREIYIRSMNRDLLISKVNIAKYYANKSKFEKVENILDEVIEDFLKGGESCVE